MQDILIVAFIIAMLWACYYVLSPIIWPEKEESLNTNLDNSERSRLNQLKDETYLAIRELEFDHTMGKLSQEDFDELKQQYMMDAAATIGEIDALNSRKKTDEDDPPMEDKPETHHDHDDHDDDEDQNIETEHKPLFCTECGAQASFSDKFCRECGTEIQNRDSA